MFRIKGKKERTVAPSAIVLRVLNSVNHHLIRWAAWLGQRTSVLPRGRLKLFLGLFCVLLTGLSTCVIISSFHPKRIAFTVTPIRVVPLVEKRLAGPAITEAEYQRFHRLRRFLDSLAGSREGRLRLDSILQAHPTLPQTLSYLEGLYSRQHKN
jgi:hypothetical protein